MDGTDQASVHQGSPATGLHAVAIPLLFTDCMLFQGMHEYLTGRNVLVSYHSE